MEASNSCQKGQNEFELALKFEKGDGVEQDLFEATEHLQKAASLGHTGAMVKLGKAHMSGCGVMRNTRKAIELFKQAASMGDTNGLLNLGIVMKMGLVLTVTQKKQ